jgi:hypothetical protein
MNRLPNARVEFRPQAPSVNVLGANERIGVAVVGLSWSCGCLGPNHLVGIHQWSGRQPNANIDLAIRAQTVLSLAEMSDRLKLACLFEEKTRRITDGAGAEIAPITYGTFGG